MPDSHPGYSNGRWWLCAILFPIGCAVAGFLLGFGVPQQETDWLGLRFFLPLLFGLPIGAVVSCTAAIISVARRERNSPIGALAGIVCLVFLVWFGASYARGREDYRHQVELNAASHRADEARMKRIGALLAEFKAHPQKITDDSFWREHTTPDREAEFGLSWFLQDESVDVTPEIADYVLRHFPNEAGLLLHRINYTPEALTAIAMNSAMHVDSRAHAIRRLARDESYYPTKEFKEMVVVEFPLELGILLQKKRFTPEELRDFARRTSLPYVTRLKFQHELERRPP